MKDVSASGVFLGLTRRFYFLPLTIGLAIAHTSVAHALSININAGSALAANTAALDAFERAGNVWESLLADPVTVNIDADLVSLGANILGSAGSVQLQTSSYNFGRTLLIDDAADEADDGIVNALPIANDFSAFMPTGFTLQDALAGTKANFKALGVTGLDAQFGATDAVINFSTDFAFDYDNSDGVDLDKIDFETVAIHEIGHALGFISAVDIIDTNAPGAIAPRLLDLFRFDADAQVPTTEAEFSTAIRSLEPGANAVFSDLDNVFGFSTGAHGGDGRQASHWKDDGLSGVLLGVMDPTLAFGQAFGISAADLRALDVIGWDFNSSVGPDATVPLPPALLLLLSSVTALFGVAGLRRRSRHER